MSRKVKLLNLLITTSVELVPRNYVLLAIKKKQPKAVTSYDAALADSFRPRKPRQNLIRKSYINNFYRKDLPMSALKELADRMRHSVSVGMSAYRKVGLEDIKEALPFEAKPLPTPEVLSLPMLAPVELKSLPIMAPPVALPPPVIVERKLKKPSEYSAE